MDLLKDPRVQNVLIATSRSIPNDIMPLVAIKTAMILQSETWNDAVTKMIEEGTQKSMVIISLAPQLVRVTLLSVIQKIQEGDSRYDFRVSLEHEILAMHNKIVQELGIRTGGTGANPEPSLEDFTRFTSFER